MTTEPDVEDPLSSPFWTAAREGRLVVQHCESCGALRWPPISGCLKCLSRDTTWVGVEPTGRVWSYVVYHRAFQASLKDQIPYTVAMVQLDAGPYIVGRMVDGEQKPTVGDRVVAEFVPTSGDVTQVRWKLA